MTTASRETTSSRRWVLPFLAAIVAVLATVFGAATASAATTPGAETRVRASQSVAQDIARPPEDIRAGQRLGKEPADVVVVVATGVAANGADNVVNGVRLRAQLTGQEISGGHAFQKHVIDKAEFPGITTRSQFAQHIEDVVSNGVMRPLERGRTGYWRDGTVVIRDPNHVDGGTAFRPTDGYDYFLGLD